MPRISIKTTQHVVPMIYAYTTPEIARHDGWSKIGYTEQGVDERIEQQTHTVDVIHKELWRGNAIFDDGSGEIFTDKDFHRYLKKLGIENDPKNEWFHVDGPTSKQHFYDFRANRGILSQLEAAAPYRLREEQGRAIQMTKNYAESHTKGEFLWNAKPRFGKSLSAYDFCKQMSARTILIITNRPAIANSWYADYEKFIGPDSGYYFVSNVDALQGKKYVITREQFQNDVLPIRRGDTSFFGIIEFVSLQDLKGSKYFNPHSHLDKLREVAETPWDVLIIDEAHEGVDTYKTDIALDKIKRKFTLHLSGTPFKALANDKFDGDAIFNWTYADEQKAKREWGSGEDDEVENPYGTLPQLNLYTYQMSEIVRDELIQGVEIQGETEEYAFDLNTFFEVKNGRFTHDSSVDRFLDALTMQEKYPFSTDELRNELKHTFWLLNRVDSARALAKKLEAHPVFGQYKIILAAGDGKIDDDDANEESFKKVTDAIAANDKTITLSVGQLTTGVTIPEWTAVLMLSNIKSPALYMQAAFRAQNPCLLKRGGECFRKEHAYVFDFDPARTLTIFEEFANDLYSETAKGRGDTETRKARVRELLNFFPVIGEDDDGEMILLDAEKVLSIPRKIRSQEVVRRGFMSNYLFQNISNIFGAPQVVLDILNTIPSVSDTKQQKDVKKEDANNVPLDENGEIKIPEEYVIGQAAALFGEKIYGDPEAIDKAAAEVADAIRNTTENSGDGLEALNTAIRKTAIETLMETAKETYGGLLRTSDTKRLVKEFGEEASRAVGKAHLELKNTQDSIERERQAALNAAAPQEKAAINERFNQKRNQAAEEFKKTVSETVDDLMQNAGREIVNTVETRQAEEKKKTVEDTIRDHLRGFSRTIPSFLMAYGSDDVTMENFDQIIPDEVFREVTSITLDQFRFLRDGGTYPNPETGEVEMFEGKLFDPVVFNDSIKEFLALKARLADYFDESSTEDIFDYVPPQRTNQIFTPKWVVAKMMDMLEEENPGCFDQPDKTFIDMYIKSGLYITEIVKRLYRSAQMKRLYPNEDERLKHIFAEQVFGLAPTEIIYRIATNYILGFDNKGIVTKHNFKKADALQFSKDGTLSEKLDELFGSVD